MSETKSYGEGVLAEVVNRKITRRSFLKWSAAIGATASATGLITQNGMKAKGAEVGYGPVTSDPQQPAYVEEWRPSCCLVCHGWCHIACGVDQWGHVRKIEGSGGQPKKYLGPINPIGTNPSGVLLPYGANGSADTIGPDIGAGVLQTKKDDANHIPVPKGYLHYPPHNKGRICAKGNDGMEHLYDPDRIKYPLMRMGPRGGGKWRKISWTQAHKHIANVLRELAGLSSFYDVTSTNPLEIPSTATLPGKRSLFSDLQIQAPRGKDLRHRFNVWIGRNENPVPPGFSKAYGVVNHIEHTSLCELTRHVVGRALWGHHWSSPDHQTHTPGNTISFPGWQSGVADAVPGFKSESYTLRDDNDTDFHLEWGGNTCEQKIPHTTVNNHLADRRRKNLEGYTYLLNDAGKPLNSRFGRIVSIDVRQSNTSAFADEYFNIVPGTDGALALGMIFYLMVVDPIAATLRNELLRGHMGTNSGLVPGDVGFTATSRRFFGLFTWEEGLPAAQLPVPTGKSLESYLTDLTATGFRAHLGLLPAALNKDVLERVRDITGIGAGDPGTGSIIYLARALAGLRIDGSYDPTFAGDAWTLTGTPRRFANGMVDCYRGPVKHSNGWYSGHAVRALQVLAANQSATHFWGNRGAPKVARGGYNAPGAFQSDKNWDPYGNGSSPLAGYGIAGATVDGRQGGDTGVIRTYQAVFGIDPAGASFPRDQGVGADEAAPSTEHQRIDNWDYDYDVPRWRGSYKWVDQNYSPGMRHSLGLNAYENGIPADATKRGPYYYRDWRTPGAGTFDTNFETEALLIHKNSPTYARPNQEGEIELFTSKVTAPNVRQGEYLLRHIWGIDINMGAGSRFADIILPDVSYLERWAERSGEGQECNYRPNVFYRIPVAEWEITIAGQQVPRHLYDSRQVKAIYYELARYVERDNGVVANDMALTVATASGGNVHTGAAVPAGVAVGDGVRAISAAGANLEYLGVVTAIIGATITTSRGVRSGPLPIGTVLRTSKTVWGGALYDSFVWCTSPQGALALPVEPAGLAARSVVISNGVNAAINDGEYAVKREMMRQTTSAGLNADAVDAGLVANGDHGYRLVKSYGMIWHNDDDPAYWRNHYTGVDANAGSTPSYVPDNGYKPGPGGSPLTIAGKLTVYNSVIDTMPDMVDSTSANIVTFATEANGTFRGHAVWMPTIQAKKQDTDPGFKLRYPLHLITHKYNVHTQSRTATLPRLQEIIGTTQVWIHPGTANGTDPVDAALAAIPIVHGGKVTVTSELGSVTGEAKLTKKIKPGVVGIAHGEGHRPPERERGFYQGAFDNYQVTESDMAIYKNNREQSTYLNVLGGANSPLGFPPGDSRAETLAIPPSAPGKGIHGNTVIQHHISGDAGDGSNISTDPIGGSQGWFDTKVRIRKG